MQTVYLNDWPAGSTEETATAAMASVADSAGCFGALLSYSPTGWLASDEPGIIYRTLQVGVDERLRRNWMVSAGDNRLQLAPSNRKFDPIRRRMVKQTLPRSFNVQELMEGSYGTLTTMQQRWCKTLLRSGTQEVVSVPVRIPPSEYWSLTLLGSKPRPGKAARSAQEFAGLMYFTHGLVHFCIDQLHWRESGQHDTQMNLRPRERDCLYWAAMGKSAEDTADILGLGTETVRKYLKTALGRLNSRNKVQAVARALQWGLLDLSRDEPE